MDRGAWQATIHGVAGVRHDLATKPSHIYAISPIEFSSWKAMAPTPVLSPGKSHGWRSLVGFSPWGR